MNRTELKQVLDSERIRRDSYDLDGGHRSETLTMAEAHGRWFVYYSERGLETGKREFATEGDACEYFLTKLLADPSAHIDSPAASPEGLFDVLRKKRIREENGHWYVAWADPPNVMTEAEFGTEVEANQFLLNKLRATGVSWNSNSGTDGIFPNFSTGGNW